MMARGEVARPIIRRRSSVISALTNRFQILRLTMKWAKLKQITRFIFLFTLLIPVFSQRVYAQELIVQGRNILHPGKMKITEGEFAEEIVEYVLLGDQDQNKPLIIFISGSMPSPLLLQMEDGKFIPIGLPFNFYGFLPKYNFLLLSKPGVPLTATQKELDSQFNFLDPATQMFPEAFLKRNHQDFYSKVYTEALVHVLKGYKNQKPPQTILVGHSQGARVATKLAGLVPEVSHLVYLSADPMGRYWEIIRRQATQADATEAQLDSLYDSWAKISSGTGSLHNESSYEQRSTKSFSENLVDDLMDLEIPVFLGYGTDDFSCADCGYVYFEAIRIGKTNFHHRPYPGLGHNFFPLLPDGRSDYNAGRWDQVAADVISWVEGN